MANPQNGHEYHLLRNRSPLGGLTWEEGEAAANALGGHLVAINDQVEFTWLIESFAGSLTPVAVDNFMWIGLNDQESEGDFVWSNGDPVTFTNWVPGEPNDAFGGEDFVHLYNYAGESHSWNDLGVARTFFDRNVTHNFSAIAEVIPVPEPTGIVLTLAGLVACLGALRLRS